MSTGTDDEERRRRSVEAGREMLEKYKAGRSSKSKGTGRGQGDEMSGEESFHNEKSMDPRESCAHEGVSSRDITHSSVSMSEGEADGDLEGLAGRVAELEELLQGKEAIVEALNAEIDYLRAEGASPNSSQSQNSSIHGRDVISLYHTKLQEFEMAINQRDNVIEELTRSLEQALIARDRLVAQLNSLSAMQISNPNAANNSNLQEKIDTLEATLSEQKSVIQKLNGQLAKIQEHVQTLEMEKETRNAEISDYKLQINNLNEQIRLGAAEKNLNIAETLEQQKQYELRVDKIKQDMQHILEKFTAETNTNTARHQQELKDLGAKHEAEIMNIQLKYEERMKSLKDENKVLADRLNKELPDLESRHAKELSVFHGQLASYKKTIESLKHELVNHAEPQKAAEAEINLYKSELNELKVQAEKSRRVQELNHQKEKEMLSEQIKLHKVQLEDMTAKYIAAAAVLKSKESIEQSNSRSLEQALSNASVLEDENEKLRSRLDSLSSRYAAAQTLIEDNQVHERSLSTRIHDLEKSLSRYSGINASTFSELNETTYQTFDDVAIQYQMAKQKLEEKEELEKILFEKIHGLEDDVRNVKQELEQANLTKESYEKQLKDMKNTCDKFKSELIALRESKIVEEEKSAERDRKNVAADLLQRIDADQQEIKNLKQTLENRETELVDYVKKLQDVTEQLKKSEAECLQLKTGLATAWAQCAEVEEKLNQTLALSDSKLDVSLSTSNYGSALMNKFRASRFNDSANTTQDQSVNENRSHFERDNATVDANIQLLETQIATMKEEKETLSKELERLRTEHSDCESIKENLHEYTARYEQLQAEKQEILDENSSMKKKLDNMHALQDSVNQLRAEKEALRKEIEALISAQDEQINAIKSESASEIRRVQSLLLSVKEGSTNLNELRADLEARHANEMEELRTYFEQKCLQMEKQYSEEVFSQQSKKMSDNDSEIEDLTDNLYFGAAGDCLNVSNISDSESRVVTPFTENQPKLRGSNPENQVKTDAEYEANIKAIQYELEHKIIKIQEMKVQHQKELEDQKNMYEKDLYEMSEKYKHQLSRCTVSQHCQTEWDTGALENGELSQLRAAYNHQLEEQVALARLDIVNALQEQIQALLTVESDGDDNWPAELLELRDRFTSNAKLEMQQLREAHSAEVHRLKDEHSRNVARMIDRHQEELDAVKAEAASHGYEKRGFDVVSSSDCIARERDSLNKMCATLKILVEELIKYFVTCEEELNNTLITEVLKRQLSESFSNNEKALELENDTLKTSERTSTESSRDIMNPPEMKIKRVHFAPQSMEIVSIMNSDYNALQAMFEDDESIADKLRLALNNCLRRLKSESAEILGLSSNSTGDRFDTLSKEIMWINKENEDLSLKLRHAETLILGYEEEAEQLKVNILDLQRKLANADSKKDIITEGYGERNETGGEVTLQDFSQLQEKARHVLSNGGGDYSYLLQLIEELCRQSDKLMDDAKKEKEDLQQQVPLEPTPPPYIHRVCRRKIDVADKQLKSTRRFLDEQASEREAERDEAAKHIQLLQEQLKDREREKDRDLRISSETSLSPESSSDVPVLQATDINAAVEALESQMREMSSLMSDTEAKKTETESELKAAIDKIWVLREIVRDLEQQLQLKVEKEESLQLQINQLETVIAAQTKNQHELVQELDSIKMGSESRQLNEHINHLQEELRKHKLSSEQFNINSAALKQMKLELRDMQNQLDKRIKELESAHMCGSNLSLSHPSEDVSIREQIDAARCPTPDDPTSPPMLPLDQLLKLKEKMVKHARAEEVAFKRIKDLEMQLSALKNQNEELQAEQEILQQTASEQLFQIEAMRGRLEQHKQSAPFAQRQATSRLELQLHEANAKFQSLERTIADKDLELKDMKCQLDRVNQLLTEKETEITNVVQLESATIQKLKDRLELVEEERKILQAKVGAQEHAQLELPRLIDSMLADKNEELDHLKEQLSKKEKQLDMYSSLALDEGQLRDMVRQTEPKNSARTLSDILSIHSECEEMSEAIRSAPNTTQTFPHNVSSFRVPASSGLPKDTLDLSAAPLIETTRTNVLIPPLDLCSNSQSITSTSHHHVSLGVDLINSGFESKNDNNVSVDDTNCSGLSKKDHDKSVAVQESMQKACNNETRTADKSVLTSASKPSAMSVKQTQTSINETIKEIENLESQLRAVQEELQVKSTILDKREADLAILQKLHDELQIEFKEVVESLTQDNCFYQNQYELSRASENKIKKDLQEVENTLKLKAEEIQEHRSKMQVNEKIIMELNSENTRLKKDMERKHEEGTKKYTALLQEKTAELQNLRDVIAEKDITIETFRTRNIEIENENEQLYEFKTKYQTSEEELSECQNEIRKLWKALGNRDQVIKKLEDLAKCKEEVQEYQHEIQRLTEGLNNRDQIIRRLEEMARRTSISGASSPSDEKDQEIHHLQEYLKEKDKVIRQMSDDSKSLHKALETIQNKMKESGNIVELRKKLKDERKLNAELRSMVTKLSKDLDDLKQLPARRSQDDTDIEDMVQRELDLSAHLDRQIMNAIESDAEESVKVDRHDRDCQDRNVQKNMVFNLKTNQTSKVNEELKKLKDDLEIERGMLKCQIAEYENRIFQLSGDLAEESKKVAKLDEELSAEKHLVRTLKIQIEKDQRAMQSGHMEDTELIEGKLKSSLDGEGKLRNELSALRQENKSLEIQLSSMKEHIQSQKMDNLPKLSDVLESERKKYISLVENFEKEERENAELRDTLKRMQMERNRYEKQLEVVIEEKEKLISSLALVEGIKEHVETDLRRTKDELKAREDECEWLQKRIKTLSDAETKRQEQRTSEHNELKALRREINNAREVMMDLEADMKQSKRELTESLEREMKLAETLESLKERESDYIKKLSAAKDEERRLREMIADLQQDLKLSTRRELELTKELKNRFSNDKNSPTKFVQKIKDLSDTNERHVNEKSILHEKLIKARDEKEQLAQCVKALEAHLKQSKGSHDVDAKNVEKVQYFYGKYIRADSRRKSLAFQKRYLLSVVGGYQLSEENTVSVLAQLTMAERSYTMVGRNRKSPKMRFRSAALVMISIQRMKWLIVRWRTGKRVGANTLLTNADQPFMSIRTTPLNHSPPVRDRPTSNGDSGLDVVALEQYYQRLRNIQHSLGLAMAEPGSYHISIPE